MSKYEYNYKIIHKDTLENNYDIYTTFTDEQIVVIWKLLQNIAKQLTIRIAEVKFNLEDFIETKPTINYFSFDDIYTLLENNDLKVIKI